MLFRSLTAKALLLTILAIFFLSSIVPSLFTAINRNSLHAGIVTFHVSASKGKNNGD